LLSSSHETWSERFVFSGLVVGLSASIQVLDGFVFQPRIVGKYSNLHPLLVILALTVGASFGLVGMIVALPTMCICRVLFLELCWHPYVEKKKLSLSSAVPTKSK
jgi:predicted PurR-regulated permease PerM